jgi:Flp pilus assembly pilin Flp
MMKSEIDETDVQPMILFVKSIWQDQQGQDLIEYALLAATLAVVVAGFLPPSVMPSVSSIFSKISGMLSNAPF